MKRKSLKKLFLILILFAGLTVAATAEAENVFETYDEALGGFFGEIGGIGLNYQKWFGALGAQVTAGLFYYPEDSYSYSESYSSAAPVNEDFFVFEIGLEAQYRVYEDSYDDWFDGCLYIFAGGQYGGGLRNIHTYEEELHDSGEGDSYYIYPTTGYTGPHYFSGFTAGFGFGFEPVFFDHFSIPIEFGLGGAWEFSSIIPVDAGLKVQGGLRYRY